jgi:MOSC domain-containing protein YiiM
MKILSIQVGLPREVPWEGKKVSTGIFKEPIVGRVWVRRLNIEGDGQADLTVHGGADKAIYAYGSDAYTWWKSRLPETDFAYGAFGENLTVDLLDENRVCLGDIFQVGGCRLQVAQPRFPCFKLGIKFGDMGILKTFMESGRPGIYFRVLAEGQIQKGDELRCIDSDPEKVPLTALFRFNTQKKSTDPALLRRILRVKSLMPTWHETISKALGK